MYPRFSSEKGVNIKMTHSLITSQITYVTLRYLNHCSTAYAFAIIRNQSQIWEKNSTSFAPFSNSQVSHSPSPSILLTCFRGKNIHIWIKVASLQWITPSFRKRSLHHWDTSSNLCCTFSCTALGNDPKSTSFGGEFEGAESKILLQEPKGQQSKLRIRLFILLGGLTTTTQHPREKKGRLHQPEKKWLWES